MPVIELETVIQAPVARVFDLSLCIDLHMESQSKHREKAVAGKTHGLIGLGEEVTWQAIHFGLRQRLRTRITALNPPIFFRDTMVAGAFKHFDHDHFFEEIKDGTLMKDRFAFSSPLGILGRLANWLFLKAYMTRFLMERNLLIKKVAETDRWRRFLQPATTAERIN